MSKLLPFGLTFLCLCAANGYGEAESEGTLTFTGATAKSWQGYAKTADPATHKFVPPEDRGYRRYPLSIMDRSTQEVYDFDPARNQPATVSYSVSKAGWVRIRMVHRENQDILLRTLQDWTPSDFGTTYKATWDGTDSSGNPINSGKVFILFESKDRARNKIHWSHEERICRDPGLTIVEPTARQVVREKSSIVAVLSDPPTGAESPSGYEAKLYIDYKLDQSLGFPGTQQRFSFSVDPGPLEFGDHIFTINLDDKQDHVGTASIILRTQR